VNRPPIPDADPQAGPDQPRSLEHFLVLGATLGALVVMLVLALAIEPDARGFGTHERLGLPSCKTMDWFGIPCPGCGVTTALTHAVRGDFVTSFATQPLGIPIALAIPLSALWALVNHLRGRDLQRIIYGLSMTRWAAGIGVAVLVVWVIQVRRFLGTG